MRIPDYITAQNEAYLAWEQNPERCASMSASDDHRVDACLFFLNPNYLKDAEVAAMAHLSDHVPDVPMIAKVRHHFYADEVVRKVFHCGAEWRCWHSLLHAAAVTAFFGPHADMVTAAGCGMMQALRLCWPEAVNYPECMQPPASCNHLA